MPIHNGLTRPPRPPDLIIDWSTLSPTTKRIAGSLALAAFVLAVVATVWRVVVDYGPPGPFDPNRQGMCDFHNGLYYPAIALADGVSPYGQTYESSYPVSKAIPFYSPSVLLLHLPMTWLPLHVAEAASLVLNYAVIFAIARLIARRVDDHQWAVAMIVAALLALSRGGHVTIFNGYFTLELVLATLYALDRAESSPLRSGLALAVVAVKPNFILPLGMLMLARGHFRAVAIGFVATLVSTGLPMAWLAWHLSPNDINQGWQTLIAEIIQTQANHQSVPWETPALTWTRIDALALIAKWIGTDPPQWVYAAMMVALVIPAMKVLNRRRKIQSCRMDTLGIDSLVITSTILVSVYHQYYDSLIFIAPLAGLCLNRERIPVSPTMAMGLIVGLSVPMLNYLSTRMVISRFDLHSVVVDGLTSINAVVVIVVWLASLRIASKNPVDRGRPFVADPA